MNSTEKIRNKILDADRLTTQIKAWRDSGMSVVFTNGCFDLIHYGHIIYLSQSADLGNKLIIGLNSDSSVKKLKGPQRPVNNELTRAMVLASMEFVDAVSIFDADTPFDLINLIKPNVLVKGGDYIAENVVGYNIVTNSGGKVMILPFIDGYSTTSLVEKITKHV